MKNLLIKTTILTGLLFAGSALADDVATKTAGVKKIPTITVVAEPEVANFEIYSLKAAESAIDASLEMMTEDFSKREVRRARASLNETASVGAAL